MTASTATEQATLLDLNGQELNSMWVDENQPLFVPNNPLHWKAHKLQVALARMEKQQEKNPAQFNSTTYLTMLNQYTEVMEQINEKSKAAKVDEILGSKELASERVGGTPPTNSEIEPISMDS